MIAFVMLCRLHLVEMNPSTLALSLNCEVGRGGSGTRLTRSKFSLEIKKCSTILSCVLTYQNHLYDGLERVVDNDDSSTDVLL